MILIPKEANTEDSPHIVDVVRVVETHAPSLLMRRKSAQHQQLGICRHERLEGMTLNQFTHLTSLL
jgi:hypothetical protein